MICIIMENRPYSTPHSLELEEWFLTHIISHAERMSVNEEEKTTLEIELEVLFLLSLDLIKIDISLIKK